MRYIQEGDPTSSWMYFFFLALFFSSYSFPLGFNKMYTIHDF